MSLLQVNLYLLTPIIMFGVIMFCAFGMQRALNKKAKRDVKKNYPKWYRKYWLKK